MLTSHSCSGKDVEVFFYDSVEYWFEKECWVLVLGEMLCSCSRTNHVLAVTLGSSSTVWDAISLFLESCWVYICSRRHVEFIFLQRCCVLFLGQMQSSSSRRNVQFLVSERCWVLFSERWLFLFEERNDIRYCARRNACSIILGEILRFHHVLGERGAVSPAEPAQPAHHQARGELTLSWEGTVHCIVHVLYTNNFMIIQEE